MTELSIVVASQNCKDTIAECLSSLFAQNEGHAAEIIVVDNSTDGTERLVKASDGKVSLVEAPKSMLIPQLWGIGASKASGDIVAFTTAHFIPDEDWIFQTLSHHQNGYSDYAGIGGAIENSRPSSAAQWAVYFCRYAPYMLPFAEHDVRQIPGDNGSYKRWVFDKYADIIEDGFWEKTVNDHLIRDGHSLLMSPRVRVKHGDAFSVGAFCKQRFIHGRLFGAERIEDESAAKRFIYAASSPLVPAIFLSKIARDVFKKGRNRKEFIFSLPFSTLFILSWSLGEAMGYILGIFHEGCHPHHE